MTAIPNDDETIKATCLMASEGGETFGTAAPSNGTDLLDNNKQVPDEDDVSQRMIDTQPPTGSENDPASLKENSTASHKTTKSEKIKVHLVAVGSAPILKKSKFLMNADDRFAVAIAFLRKVLKLSSSFTTSNSLGMKASSLFLYVNAAFVPSPDERIGDLFDCFGSRGELVVHYSLQEAWG